MTAQEKHPVGEATRRWIEGAVGPGSRVKTVRRLTGGTSSAVHAVRVEAANGRTVDLVLRRWVAPLDGRPHPPRVERESRTLLGLRERGYPHGPELVAADPTGDATDGRPALLMTRLAGRLLLRPDNPRRWLQQIARELVAIHALEIDAPPYEPWFGAGDLLPKPWRRQTGAWAEAARIVGAGLPSEPGVFLHRDYQHFNLLWTGQRLSGVIDWTEASRGPREVDVAHCRWNLAVLFSVEVAEEFRLLYESECGQRTDPRFDLAELIGYGPWAKAGIPAQVAGRRPVDVEGMDGRVEELLVSALARC